MINLGFYNTSSSRTHVGFQFSTHAAAGGNVAPNSAFEAADLRIYRAADGAAFSATQRSSANGITMTSPFDSLTGFHDVDIDLTDNTDAGFYAAGYRYTVVLAPDETVDGQTITAVVLAFFEIGLPAVNTTHLAGTSQTGRDIGASVLLSSGTGTGQISLSSGAVLLQATQTGVTIPTVTNLTNAPTAGDFTATMKTSIGTAVAASAVASVTGNVGGNVAGSVGSVTGAVGSVTGNVGGNVAGSVGSVTGLTATDVGDIKAKTDNLPSDPADQSLIIAATDAITSAIAALENVSVANILGATVEGSTTLVQSLRLLNAALGGKASGLETTSVVYRDIGDTKDRIAATVDADGNRSAVTLDLT